jgi:hypothetical protein
VFLVFGDFSKENNEEGHPVKGLPIPDRKLKADQ